MLSLSNDEPLITYEITGSGFLRHMVRAIVGTLVEIGRGRRPPEWMREVVASRDRSAAGVDRAGRGPLSGPRRLLTRANCLSLRSCAVFACHASLRQSVLRRL